MDAAWTACVDRSAHIHAHYIKNVLELRHTRQRLIEFHHRRYLAGKVWDEMFDMYQLPDELAVGGHLELIKREIRCLRDTRHERAQEISRRMEQLLHTPTRDFNQERLLMSALLREVDALHHLASEGITGWPILPQPEEATMVRLYLKTAALHSILERTLANPKPVQYGRDLSRDR